MGDREPGPSGGLWGPRPGEPGSEPASRRARRRKITFSLLRSGFIVVILVVGYYLAPLDRPIDAATGVELAIGLLVLAAFGYWQVRSVLDSDTPRLRAIQVIAVGLPLLLLLFASTYVLLAQSTAQSFTEPLSRTDALYFTVTVFATVGFGDIAPVTEVARVVTMIQMLVGITAVGVVAKVLLGAVQVAVQRREETTPRAAEDPDVAGGPGGSARSE